MFASLAFVSESRIRKVDPIVVDRDGDIHRLWSLASSTPPTPRYGYEWHSRRHWQVDGWLDEDTLVLTKVDGSLEPPQHARTEIGYLPVSEPGPVFRLMRRGDG